MFNDRLLVVPIEVENDWGLKDEAKLGRVAFPNKTEDNDFKKGDEIYYQYGTEVKIDGKKYVLVRESDLICQK